MCFTWIDYPAQYEDAIEAWCDESAIRFALDDDSVKSEHQWYLDSDKCRCEFLEEYHMERKKYLRTHCVTLREGKDL